MTFPEGSRLAQLLDGPVRPGRIVWIGVRPERRAPMLPLGAVEAHDDEGLEGDRYRRRGGRRQVTLISEEALTAIAAFMGRNEVPPEALRRNLVTRGINLLALKGRRVQAGAAVLEVTGECQPCSFLEQSLGPGGYNAVRGLGGLTAMVRRSGRIEIGDRLARLDGGP